MSFPKKVTFYHPDGAVHTEPFTTFVVANGTDRCGGRRILELWQEKGWIVRRPDGAFDVKSKRSRRDPWTMDQLRAEGLNRA